MKYNSRRNLEGNKKKTLSPVKIPLLSPTVYRPLLLISTLHCLLQCSGSQFIKKFMIQILDSHSPSKSSPVNVTVQTDENNIKTDELDYALPLVILSVRLAVIFLMSFLVKKLRLRFLYFLSLFTTLILLVCLALISDPALIGLNLPDITGSVLHSHWSRNVEALLSLVGS